MKIKKFDEVRKLTRVKDNQQFAKCFAVISAAGERSELFQALTAVQIASLIESINDRATVTNWTIDNAYENGFNPAYTVKA